MPVETTWDARVFGLSGRATSQIVSIDLATGKRSPRTTGPGLKMMPQWLPGDRIGFLTKAGRNNGVGYSDDAKGNFPGTLRSPAWSPDGKLVVYEKVDYAPRPQNQLLYSWDPAYEYRYSDVFPSFSKDGTLLVTNKDVDSSVVIRNADGANKRVVYQAKNGVAFSPSWSPDGQSIAFGFGGYFQDRRTSAARIMLVNKDGTGARELTAGMPNAGFPSWSPTGKAIVFRTFGPGESGLRIVNLEDHSVKILTAGSDNLPYWSPDGTRILFTRRDGENFDIYTINPDGAGLRRLTTYPASDAHAVWTSDGRSILWNSGEYGFKDEAALYDHSFQPYGSIWIMKADGTGKRQLTDGHWEDAMPCFVPTP